MTRREYRNSRVYHVPEMDEHWPPVPALGLLRGEALSVTTILDIIDKPALKYWAAGLEREACVEAAVGAFTASNTTPASFEDEMRERLGEAKAHVRESQRAKDIGTQTHRIVEAQLAGQSPALPEDATIRRCVGAWEAWRTGADLRTVWTERTVYHRTERYAGTADFHGTIGAVPVIADWKTGRTLYAQAFAQVAAYVMAARDMELVGEDCCGLLLRLPKTAEDAEAMPFESRVLTTGDVADHYEAFKHAQHLAAWNRRMS